MDSYVDETGFTAMERTTGWDAAIVARGMVREQTPRGAVPPDLFVKELAKRGIQVHTKVAALD